MMNIRNRRANNMTKVERLPPTALDLQAFIDDELPPDDRIWVAEWLLEHPNKALEVFQTMLREELLRTIVNRKER